MAESRPGLAWACGGQGSWLQRGPEELSGVTEMFYRGDGGLHRCIYLSALICTPQIGVCYCVQITLQRSSVIKKKTQNSSSVAEVRVVVTLGGTMDRRGHRVGCPGTAGTLHLVLEAECIFMSRFTELRARDLCPLLHVYYTSILKVAAESHS